MGNEIHKLRSENTILRIVMAAILVFCAGSFMLMSSSINDWWVLNSPWRALTRDIGSLFVVSVALALLWEFLGKKSLVNEVSTRVSTAQNIRESGLQRIVYTISDFDWDELFRTCSNVDLFFAYNSQWRTSNEVRLRDFVRRNNVKLRLIIPDIDESSTMTDLAARFNKEPERIREKIKEAREQFVELANHFSKHESSSVEIFSYKLSLCYALYRFGDTYIVSLYTQKAEKGNVPHLVFQGGGTLAQFFDLEISALTTVSGSLINQISTDVKPEEKSSEA